MLDTVGEHEEAEEVLRAVESQARTDEERAQIVEARCGNLFRGLGRAAEAEEVGLVAERAITDRDLRDELVSQRAIHALLAADMNEALELSVPLLDESNYPGRVVVKAALAAGAALALSGRTADAIRVSDRAFALRMELGDQVQMAGPGVYLVARALALTEAGRLAEAEGTAQAGYDGAVESQVLEGQGWFTVMLGRICLLQGRVVTASRWLREAAVLWGELVHPSAGWGFGGLAHALALAGDLEGAERAIDDLHAEPPTPIHMMDVDIERGRAWYTWFRGEHARALEMLRGAADFGVERGQYALAAGAFHDLARLGEPAEVVEHLEGLVEHVDGELMPTRLAHATALAKRDATGLDEASERFEAIGAWLFAAEAANQASLLYERDGLRRRASAAAQRASALAERCEGARTPALETGPQPVALTKREREVATLAARGLTSREIAETIVVSTRTVENHLQRAYEKLGVSGRAELAEALGDDA
jgi:ATP/maltotriose-dependent transcriptional regulator MalT